MKENRRGGEREKEKCPLSSLHQHHHDRPHTRKVRSGERAEMRKWKCDVYLLLLLLLLLVLLLL